MDVSSSKHTRVLFLIPTLTGGGAERVITTLLQHFDRNKFQLSIAIIDTRNAVFRSNIPTDVEYIDLHCSRVRYALPKIVGLIWRLRPNVVFSTLGHLNLVLAMLRPLLPNGVKYFARETALVSQNIAAYRMRTIWAWALRRFYRQLDKVICQSYAMRDDLVLFFLVPSNKAEVIHNPVDIASIRQSASRAVDNCLIAGARINLVAAGRLSYEKGFDILIEALALTSDREICLTLLGEGPLAAELLALVNARELQRRVCFAGFQSNPYPYIAQADAFVLSSRHEGFPNVVLEALALQTPVVALPSPGGVREMLTGIAGCVLTKDMSAIALARALDSIAPGQRLAKDVALPFAVDAIVSQYERALLT